MNNCAGVLLKHKNQCLLCKRSKSVDSLPGVWSIPGGHMEQNESPLKCANRELLEETGFVILGDMEFLTKFKLPEGKGNFYVYGYEMKYKITPNLDSVQDGFEHDICKWFSKKTLPDNVEPQLFSLINRLF